MEKKEKFSKKIEELKDKLYSKRSLLPPKERTKIHEVSHQVSNRWKTPLEEEVVKKPKKNLLKSTMFRKLFFGSIIFFLLSSLFGLYMFFGESNTVSANNIDITVLGNAFAAGGEDLPLEIQISNRNSVGLEYADLLIEYQRGAGVGEDIYRERIGIGNIRAGDVAKKLLNVVLFGGQGTVRDINITIEYRVPGSNAIFVKQKVYTVNISSAPINLLVTGPENSGSNQDLSFTIKTSLNTKDAVKNILVKADYPRGFNFISSNPAPTFGDNIWVLGDLTPGTQKDIKVNGTIIAQYGEQRAFNVYVGQQKDVNERDIGSQFNSQSYIVSIQKPVLDTRFLINNNPASDVVVTPGGNLQGKIEWKNLTNTRLTDVEITAEILGGIINYASIQSSTGFFESATNKIIWNRQNTPQLGDIKPGQSGTLNFGLQILPTIQNSSEANINISIKAKNPENNNEILDIKNFDRKVLKIATKLQMVGHALYRSGSFVNTGPLPPKPGEATTYTISWSLVNSLNDVSGAEIRGKLPIYVEWMSSVSPANESVVYNPITKEIVWNAGNLKKGTGSSLPPREVQFQVRFNPSTIHSGKTMNLVENITYKGLDVVTNALVTGVYTTIKHELNKDLNYNSQNDRVE